MLLTTNNNEKNEENTLESDLGLGSSQGRWRDYGSESRWSMFYFILRNKQLYHNSTTTTATLLLLLLGVGFHMNEKVLVSRGLPRETNGNVSGLHLLIVRVTKAPLRNGVATVLQTDLTGNIQINPVKDGSMAD